MDLKVMKALLEAFDRSDWQELTVTMGSDRVHVSRQANGSGPPEPATEPAPSSKSAPTEAPDTASAPPAGRAPDASSHACQAPATSPSADGTVIASPSVGMFWRAPSPGAPPFVEVGDQVAAGDTVAIVEVMKLMNHVAAPVAGTVAEIRVDNGAPVEYGDELIVIEPA